MKKTIVLCDRCGKEGTMVKVSFVNSFYYLCAIENDKKLGGDICIECASKVLWLGILRRRVDGSFC